VSLIVRRVKIADLPKLETIEKESLKRFPGRKGWMETYQRSIERALADEPEGLLVAEQDNAVVGAIIVQQRGKHSITRQTYGALLGLTVGEKWRGGGIGVRLLKEAEAYLKARGCESLALRLPADAGTDAELFQDNGFRVVAWELEKQL
jgi:ribosomal protein S18 acetylase RimI-like enzyme